MKKLFSVLLIFLFLLTPVTGFAQEVNALDKQEGVLKLFIPSSDSSAMTEVFETLRSYHERDFKLDPDTNSKFDSVDLFTFSGDTELKFNLGAFDGATQKSKTIAFKTFIDVLQDSNVSLETQQNIFNVLTDFSPGINVVLTTVLFNRSGADLFTASIWARPFMQGVQPLIGIGVILILAWLIISSIIDVVWLGIGNIPEDNKKPKWLSTDAFAVMKESSEALAQNKYKGVYGAYLIKRSTTYIIVGVIILTLLVAEIGGLLGKILNIVGGVFN
jgi:hypothetical protein